MAEIKEPKHNPNPFESPGIGDFSKVFEKSFGAEDEEEEDKVIPKEGERKEEEKPAPKPKKSKEETVQELRARKDEFKSKYEATQKELEELKNEVTRNEAYTPLNQYINDKYANLENEDERIQRYIEDQKARARKLKEIESKEQEREEYFKQTKITATRDWQENVEKPINDALQLFNTALVNEFNEDGTPVIQSDQLAKLQNIVWDNGKQLSVPELKGRLQKFKKDYEEETGEIFDIPPIADIVKSRNELLRLAMVRQEKLQNWDKEKKTKEQQQLLKEQETNQKLQEESARARKAAVADAKRSWTLDEYKGFISKDDVNSAIESVYEESEKIISGEAQKSYDELLKQSAKAILFDKYIKSFVESLKFKKEYDELGEGFEGKPGKGSKREESGEKKESWIDADMIRPGANG